MWYVEPRDPEAAVALLTITMMIWAMNDTGVREARVCEWDLQLRQWMTRLAKLPPELIHVAEWVSPGVALRKTGLLSMFHRVQSV
jgi:hypothetical protein